MMIASMLKEMNVLFHSDFTEETYTVTRARYTRQLFDEVCEVMAKTVDDKLRDTGAPSFHDTVYREYKIYFGEIPFIQKEIERISMSFRVGYEHKGEHCECEKTGEVPCMCPKEGNGHEGSGYSH